MFLLLGSIDCNASQSRYMELADSADYFINHELWNKAEEKIYEALRLEPANFNNALLLSNLGIVHTQKGEYEKALESYSLGLSISPSSTVIHNNRAKTYLILEDYNAALQDIDISLEIDSIQEWPLQTKALLLLQFNQTELSKKFFESLRDNFPENPIAYSGLATIAAREGDVDEALRLYKTACEIDKDDEETLCSYIFLLIETEKFSEARSLLRNALSKNSDNPMFYLLRGYLSQLNHLLNEAQADKKIAIDKGLDPEYAKSFIP